MSQGFWHDPDFQQKLVQFLCKDRNFLKNTARLLRPQDFKPGKGEGLELYWIATAALDFYHKYNDPIGGLLRAEMLDFARQKHLHGRVKERLMDAVAKIKQNDHLVAVAALERKVVEYKRRRARRQAIQEIIENETNGTLSDDVLVKICNQVIRNYDMQYRVVDYLETSEQRIARRRLERLRRWPYIFIDPIDAKIRVLSRGNLGLCLAKYKVGKSLFLVWLANAYALQGYNVLYFTLEDQADQVEDRFDGLLTNIAMKSLSRVPNKFKRRFKTAKEILKARLKIVDGTEGGMSVQMIENIWDQERNKGFSSDVVIVDYDDEIDPPKPFAQRETGRRFEFADIYRELRRFAARHKLFVWTAAQARRGKDENQKVITGTDAAEDISKIRKVSFCLGIGKNLEYGEDGRHLFIAAHKYDKSHVGFDVVGDFKRGLFYDREQTDIIRQRLGAKLSRKQ